MKKLLLFAIIAMVCSSVFGQERLDGIYEKEHIANRKPIPYPHVREADVMWAKKVWRIIDLREKINLPLYYPIETVEGRYSLIQLLMQGIQYEGLTAFSTAYENEFQVPMTYEQVMQSMGAVGDTLEVRQDDGTYETQIIAGELRPEQVKQIMVKEMWYFDRNYSKMDVRILGLCPIREYSKGDGATEQMVRKAVFWIYFPEARDMFARNDVFNPRNDSQRRSFDDIFMKRYFGSYISKETNVYNNRRVDQYAVGMEAMLESERIKNDIFTFEHDLWEF